MSQVPLHPPPPLLAVDALSLRFGGIDALRAFSFNLAEGQIVGLIGPNGAGKTSLFNCLSGLYTPQSGQVRFAQKLLLGLPAHHRAALGLARTFQHLALCDSQSVIDNVLLGAHTAGRGGFVATVLGGRALAHDEAALQERARAALASVGLESFATARVDSLPFAVRRRVEFARALAAAPRLLLLDEPAAGLNAGEIDVLRAQIESARRHWGCAVLLVEHHLPLVMSVCDHVVVMNFGQKIAEGPPKAIQRDPRVIEAYFGTADA